MKIARDATEGRVRPHAEVGPSPAAVEVVSPPPPAERGERGMVSAEWAVGIIAAIAIAGVLLAVVTSGPVEEALLRFILALIRRFSAGL